MDIQEKIKKLRALGYRVDDRIGTRSTTGETVLYFDNIDLDEQFVDHLILGANFHEVQIMRNKWLASR